MTLPLLGVAVTLPHYAGLKDWICGPGRTIEIQDFCPPGVMEGDTSDLVTRWQSVLGAHKGPRGIHGPFFGLDLSTPDREIRAIVQKRFLNALEIAEALQATHMVVHSPFTYWHLLNRRNYAGIEAQMNEAAADCLAPVLARAAEAGCTLMLENIDDTDPAVRVQMVRNIDHPNLKVSLDTGHAELAHGSYNAPPVVDFVDAAKGLLGHVHLQDADGYADRHWHPGDGRIPWRPVFDALAACDPAPRLILEVRNNLDRLPATVAALQAQGLAC
ncbi:MAG: sugar phosphate isomerase/epimerase family protein [Pararhodobacter sp.]